MQIILLTDVEKLGLRGDVVDVARGYARNYLPAHGRDRNAGAGCRAAEGRRRARTARGPNAEQAEEIAEILGKTVLRFEVKSGPTGSSARSPSDVADEIWRARKIRVDRRKISIDPIKRIGRYAVPIELFQDVHVEVKTLVVPEGGELLRRRSWRLSRLRRPRRTLSRKPPRRAPTPRPRARSRRCWRTKFRWNPGDDQASSEAEPAGEPLSETRSSPQPAGSNSLRSRALVLAPAAAALLGNAGLHRLRPPRSLA